MASQLLRLPPVSYQRSQANCDVILVCSDGRTHCHQAVLSLHSQYLGSLLADLTVLTRVDLQMPSFDGVPPIVTEKRVQDVHQSTILLPDYTVRVVDMLLDVLYLGQCGPILRSHDYDEKNRLKLYSLYNQLRLDQAGGLPPLQQWERVRILPQPGLEHSSPTVVSSVPSIQSAGAARNISETSTVSTPPPPLETHQISPDSGDVKGSRKKVEGVKQPTSLGAVASSAATASSLAASSPPPPDGSRTREEQEEEDTTRSNLDSGVTAEEFCVKDLPLVNQKFKEEKLFEDNDSEVVFIQSGVENPLFGRESSVSPDIFSQVMSQEDEENLPEDDTDNMATSHDNALSSQIIISNITTLTSGGTEHEADVGPDSLSHVVQARDSRPSSENVPLLSSGVIRDHILPGKDKSMQDKDTTMKPSKRKATFHRSSDYKEKKVKISPDNSPPKNKLLAVVFRQSNISTGDMADSPDVDDLLESCSDNSSNKGNSKRNEVWFVKASRKDQDVVEHEKPETQNDPTGQHKVDTVYPGSEVCNETHVDSRDNTLKPDEIQTLTEFEKVADRRPLESVHVGSKRGSGAQDMTEEEIGSADIGFSPCVPEEDSSQDSSQFTPEQVGNSERMDCAASGSGNLNPEDVPFSVATSYDPSASPDLLDYSSSSSSKNNKSDKNGKKYKKKRKESHKERKGKKHTKKLGRVESHDSDFEDSVHPLNAFHCPISSCRSTRLGWDSHHKILQHFIDDHLRRKKFRIYSDYYGVHGSHSCGTCQIKIDSTSKLLLHKASEHGDLLDRLSNNLLKGQISQDEENIYNSVKQYLEKNTNKSPQSSSASLAYHCDTCGKEVQNKTDLERHKARKHKRDFTASEERGRNSSSDPREALVGQEQNLLQRRHTSDAHESYSRDRRHPSSLSDREAVGPKRRSSSILGVVSKEHSSPPGSEDREGHHLVSSSSVNESKECHPSLHTGSSNKTKELCSNTSASGRKERHQQPTSTGTVGKECLQGPNSPRDTKEKEQEQQHHHHHQPAHQSSSEDKVRPPRQSSTFGKDSRERPQHRKRNTSPGLFSTPDVMRKTVGEPGMKLAKCAVKLQNINQTGSNSGEHFVSCEANASQSKGSSVLERSATILEKVSGTLHPTKISPLPKETSTSGQSSSHSSGESSLAPSLGKCNICQRTIAAPDVSQVVAHLHSSHLKMIPPVAPLAPGEKYLECEHCSTYKNRDPLKKARHLYQKHGQLSTTLINDPTAWTEKLLSIEKFITPVADKRDEEQMVVDLEDDPTEDDFVHATRSQVSIMSPDEDNDEDDNIELLGEVNNAPKQDECEHSMSKLDIGSKGKIMREVRDENPSRHMNMLGSSQGHSCNICDQLLKNSQELSAHVLFVHLTDSDSFCQQLFKKKGRPGPHSRTMYFSCRFCKYSDETVVRLVLHANRNHNDELCRAVRDEEAFNFFRKLASIRLKKDNPIIQEVEEELLRVIEKETAEHDRRAIREKCDKSEVKEDHRHQEEGDITSKEKGEVTRKEEDKDTSREEGEVSDEEANEWPKKIVAPSCPGGRKSLSGVGLSCPQCGHCHSSLRGLLAHCFLDHSSGLGAVLVRKLTPDCVQSQSTDQFGVWTVDLDRDMGRNNEDLAARIYFCSTCNYSAKEKDDILEHTRRHQNGVQLQCPMCFYLFYETKEWTNHTNSCFVPNHSAAIDKLRCQLEASSDVDPRSAPTSEETRSSAGRSLTEAGNTSSPHGTSTDSTPAASGTSSAMAPAPSTSSAMAPAPSTSAGNPGAGTSAGASGDARTRDIQIKEEPRQFALSKPGSYPCTHQRMGCKEVFQSKEALQEHSVKKCPHQPRDRFKCPRGCGRRFFYQDDFESHKAKAACIPTNYYCRFCSEKFRNYEEILPHIIQCSAQTNDADIRTIIRHQQSDKPS